MNYGELKTSLDSFRKQRILVVGDLMVDEYVHGSVRRISPEAPVPVVEVTEERFVLGGAANVVSNLISLGASVTLVSVLGDDEQGKVALEELRRIGANISGVQVRNDRRTTLKTRIVANNQQVVRVDREVTDDVNGELEKTILEAALAALDDVDAVILSDYGKGVLTRTVVEVMAAEAGKRDLIATADPKVSHFDLYHGLTTITPNHNEAGQALGRVLRTLDDVKQATADLRQLVGTDMMLITFAAQGMVLLDAQGSVHHIPATAKQVFDVTGAGDTVIAALTVALAAGLPPVEATRIANLSAGIVVGKFGTATVSVRELREVLSDMEHDTEHHSA